MTANAQRNFVVGSQTLTPGGAAINVAITPISIPTGPSASAIIVNGQVITVNYQGTFVIRMQTLIPGGLGFKVSRISISLAPSALQVFVGGATRPKGDIVVSMPTAPGA